MASTFHLGAYHELADTFTLGFEKKEEKKEEKKKQNFKFFCELPSFFFSAISQQKKKRCNIAEISPPDGQRLYKQPCPVQGAFD